MFAHNAHKPVWLIFYASRAWHNTIHVIYHQRSKHQRTCCAVESDSTYACEIHTLLNSVSQGPCLVRFVCFVCSVFSLWKIPPIQPERHHSVFDSISTWMRCLLCKIEIHELVLLICLAVVKRWFIVHNPKSDKKNLKPIYLTHYKSPEKRCQILSAASSIFGPEPDLRMNE